MARRKFRHSRRKNSPNERTYQEYISNQPAPLTTRTELIRLIRGGEDTYLELKLKLSNPDRIAQEIVALANTGGGTLVFGVTDNLRIEGVRNPEGVQQELVRICREAIYPEIIPFIDIVAFDNGSRVVAIDIVPKKQPYRTRTGKFFLRIGAEKREATREELSSLIEETRPLFYENIPISGVTEKDFDDSLIWSFAEGFESKSNGRQHYETANFLRRDLLLAAGNAQEFLPTVAALLLFGKDERITEFVPQASVVAQRFSGVKGSAQLVEEEILNGNLHSLNEKIVSFVERYCDLWKHRSKKSKTREQEAVNPRANFHLYSIREAVANLLSHRDLALLDGETRISVYDDHIELVNPRRTNGFVPPASKAIRFGITQRVNPQISAIFSRREYGAGIPLGGLPMILKQSELFSGKRAEVFTANDQFRLKIYGI